MGLGAAIVGGAAIGAVGSIAAGSMQADAAENAASTQADAARYASDSTMAQYRQTRADLQPYTQTGYTANKLLSQGLTDGSLTNQFSMSQADLAKTPGYQFNLTQGLKAVQNSAAARGLGVSGAAMKGAASYATGLADNTYQNQFNNYQTQQTNSYNRLMGAVQLGQNSAATTGAQGLNATANANNALMGGAAASAAGQMGAANAWGGAIAGGANNIGNNLMQYSMFGSNGGFNYNKWMNGNLRNNPNLSSNDIIGSL